jgi:glutaredoxin
MKLKQSVKLLLIALFVWVSQSTTIHFQHHELEEISECNVCDTFQKMKLYQHNSPVVVINENPAIIIRREAEKIVVNPRFDYTDIPQFKQIDIVKHSQYTDRFLALGFNATAPPIYFYNQKII